MLPHTPNLPPPSAPSPPSTSCFTYMSLHAHPYYHPFFIFPFSRPLFTPPRSPHFPILLPLLFSIVPPSSPFDSFPLANSRFPPFPSLFAYPSSFSPPPSLSHLPSLPSPLTRTTVPNSPFAFTFSLSPSSLLTLIHSPLSLYSPTSFT